MFDKNEEKDLKREGNTKFRLGGKTIEAIV